MCSRPRQRFRAFGEPAAGSTFSGFLRQHWALAAMGQKGSARAALACTLAVAFAACPSTTQTTFNATVVQFAAAEVNLLHLSLGQFAIITWVLHCQCTVITALQRAAMVHMVAASCSLPQTHYKSSEANLYTSSNSLSGLALCYAGQWSCQSELWVWPIEPDQLSLWQGSIHQCQQPLPGGLTSGRLWAVLPVDLRSWGKHTHISLRVHALDLTQTSRRNWCTPCHAVLLNFCN